jgi:hypothetical protein
MRPLHNAAAIDMKRSIKEKKNEDGWNKANDRTIFVQKILYTQPPQNFRKLPADPRCNE